MSLLATTALALSAGVAYAEVSISGDARMGLVYTGSVAAKQGALTDDEVDAINEEFGTSFAALDAVTATDIGSLTTAVTSAKDAAVQDNAALTILNALRNDAGLALATNASTAAALSTAITTQRALAVAAQDADTIAALDAYEEALNEILDSDDVNAAAALLAAAAGTAGVDSSIVLEKRMNVYMNAAVETTSGLTFGASVAIRSNEGATGLNGARVYMATNGLEVGVGNINGAIESMPNLYNPIGLTGLGWDNVGNTVARAGVWDAYDSTGNGAEGVEAIYTAGGFTGHISYSDATLSKGNSSHQRVAGALAYAMGDWTVALGMQKSDVAAEDKTILTVGGKVGDFGVKFSAADNDGVRKIALAGSATMGATTISATVSDDESAADNYMGLGLSHDLGGASLKAGVARTTSGNTIADMGVSFSF